MLKLLWRLSLLTDGEDFDAGSVPITFKAGQTRACGNITIVNDNVRESEIEMFTVDIQVPSAPLSPMLGTRTSVPVEIEDDDSELFKLVYYISLKWQL